VSVHQPLYFTATSSALKTPENTEDDADECEAADKGEIQLDSYSDQLYSNCRSSNKKLPVRAVVSVVAI
jgi:hypothetical protein